MVKPTSRNFRRNLARCRHGTFTTSAFLAIVLGSLAPDIDILWHGHRGWTHNPLVPMGVCLAILIVVVVTFTGRLHKDGLLKWNR